MSQTYPIVNATAILPWMAAVMFGLFAILEKSIVHSEVADLDATWNSSSVNVGG